MFPVCTSTTCIQSFKRSISWNTGFIMKADRGLMNTMYQCRSKGNISGGAHERRRCEPLGMSGGMLPQKILKSRGLKMLFSASCKSYLWFTHIANYLLLTLSQQTNASWEYNTCNVNYKIDNRLSLYPETSKCFTFQSHHSKFVVVKLSELP